MLVFYSILIVMKSKTNSVHETCIQSVNKAVEAKRQRLLWLKAAIFMPGKIFLFLVIDDAYYHCQEDHSNCHAFLHP